MNIRKIISKGSIVKAAGLGAGAIGADLLSGDNVAGKIFTKPEQAKFKPAVPLVAGLIAHSSGKPFIKNIGSGMVAVAASKVIKEILPAEVKTQLGIGNVMMGNVPAPAVAPSYGGDPLLSGTENSVGYDFTENPVGEMGH